MQFGRSIFHGVFDSKFPRQSFFDVRFQCARYTYKFISLRGKKARDYVYLQLREKRRVNLRSSDLITFAIDDSFI